MGFRNKYGESISYECSDLIEELRYDIEEFGGNKIVNVWCKEYEGVTLYTNYDFISDEEPVEEAELEEGEYIREMTMTALLVVLEKQNEIL